MQIKVNKQLAVMKRNTSFQYIAENRNFTGSDSYSLNIVFPLKGCTQNLAIFGHINRKDVEEGQIYFDAELQDRSFYKSGVIAILEISETEVKTQFLEGRSVQNYNATFDDIYINQLNLGNFPNKEIKEAAEPEVWWRVTRPIEDYVALPWVNNSSGILNNEVKYNASTKKYEWAATEGNLSHQAFLIFYAARIFTAVGYTYDLSEWENSKLSYLLVCNTLPSAWDKPEMALALPRWSVSEFIEELELLLAGEFEINHNTKHITFNFTKKINEAIDSQYINKVKEEYTQEISSDTDAEYLLTQNLAYKDVDHLLSPYYSCNWFIKNAGKKATRYETLDELIQVAKGLEEAGVVETSEGVTFYNRGYRKDSLGNNLFYAADVDTYFIMFCYDAKFVKATKRDKVFKYKFRLMPVNQFGDRIIDEENEDTTTLNIVPVPIIDTGSDLGSCIYLEPGNYDDVTISEEEETDERYFVKWSTIDEELDDDYYNNGGIAYSAAGYTIKKGKGTEGSGEYYSNIFVGFWDGNNYFDGFMPRPVTDRVTITDDSKAVVLPEYNIRINERESALRTNIAISDKRKYQFSFISDTIPDPRSIFYIKSIPYICEKLTATFTERGKSQLVKGVFYRKTD